jgi:putative endonuclease
MRTLYVYILASRSRTLYTGVTNNLEVRLQQHRLGLCAFTARYRIGRLVYYTTFSNAADAIAAEKRIKAWTRAKRVALIASINPSWRDLSEDWRDDSGPADPSLRSG